MNPTDTPEDSRLFEAKAESGAGRHLRALELYALMADDTLDVVSRSDAVRGAASACLRLGKGHEAVAWAELLRSLVPADADADLHEASAYLLLGDHRRALAILDKLKSNRSGSKNDVQSMDLSHLRCVALIRAGRDSDGVEDAIRGLSASVDLPDVWEALTVVASRSAIDMGPVVAMVRDEQLRGVVAQLLEGDPAGADVLLETFWSRWPNDRRILTGVAVIGGQFELGRALEWSVRLRSGGFSEHCAVLGRAARVDLPASEQIRAAATADGAFADPRSYPLIESAAGHLPDAELEVIARDVAALGSDTALEALVVASATTPLRTLILVRVLTDLSALDAALHLVAHACELRTGPRRDWDDLRDRVLSPQTVDVLVAHARALGQTGPVDLLSD